MGAFSGAAMSVPWYIGQGRSMLHEPLILGLSAVCGAAFFPRRVVPSAQGKCFFAILPKTKQPAAPPQPALEEPDEFGLWIGKATGKLKTLGSLTGINAHSNITLQLRDAAKNFTIFGEVGTGKTTRVVTPLVLQALEFDAGALIFDIRGDYAESVECMGEI